MKDRKHFSIVDIDHTLFPLDDAIYEVVKEFYPEEALVFAELLADETTRSFTGRVQKRKEQLPQLSKLNGGELIRFSGKQKAYMNTPPYKNSKLLLEKLIQKSDVLIVTARGTPENTNRSYDNGYELTKSWLDKYELPYDKLLFHISKEDAAQEYYQETGKQPYLFFDDHEHYMAMMSLHKPPFMHLAMRKLIHNEDFIYRNYNDLIIVDDNKELIDKLKL